MSVAPPIDDCVARLARLFREHPAWRKAARMLSRRATSTVYFRHLGRDPWRLEQHRGETELLPGAAPDPDLVFRFSPDAVAALERVDGDDVDDFAVALFRLVEEGAVDLRVAAPFRRLLRRGYVKLLVAAGPAIVAFGAARGVRTVGALRRLVADARSDGPADWEA